MSVTLPLILAGALLVGGGLYARRQESPPPAPAPAGDLVSSLLSWIAPTTPKGVMPLEGEHWVTYYFIVGMAPNQVISVDRVTRGKMDLTHPDAWYRLRSELQGACELQPYPWTVIGAWSANANRWLAGAVKVPGDAGGGKYGQGTCQTWVA